MTLAPTCAVFSGPAVSSFQPPRVWQINIGVRNPFIMLSYIITVRRSNRVVFNCVPRVFTYRARGHCYP